LTVVIVAVLWVSGWLPAVERVASDALLRLHHPNPVEIPVCAVVIDDLSVTELGPLPWPRARIAALVEGARNAGASGVILDLIVTDRGDSGHDAALANALAAGPSVASAVIGPGGHWILPLPEMGGVGIAAHAHAEVGPDGVVRTILATKQADGISLPALSVAASRIVAPDTVIAAGTVLRPDFRPAPPDIPQLSAATVLAGAADPRVMKDRLAFIGVSAAGAGDRFVVPTGSRHRPDPGVLIHASAAASILRGGLVHASGLLGAMVGALLIAVAAQVWRSRSGRVRAIQPLGLAIAAVIAGIVATRWGLMLPVASVLTADVLAFLLREGFEAHAVRRESGALLSALHGAMDEGQPDVPSPRSASDRLAALEQLQQRVVADRELRGALLEGMSDGVVLWGSDGRLRYANAAAQRLWGGVPRLEDLEGGSGGGDDALEIRRRHLVLSIRQSRLAGGILVLLHDMTSERELERRRRDMQRLVSHELKTPLASIGGLASMLERYQLSDDELHRVAGLIRTETRRLTDMVGAFLDLERLGGGGWDEQRSALDLSVLTRDRVEFLTAAAHDRDQKLELHDKAPVWVDGVPELLERVVDNLIGNALKYTPHGGRIEVRVDRHDDFARLEVNDNGPGIPAAAVTRLFDRFYRVPGADSTGSGLGLALVREIVDWHGGCIDVESTVGAGSVFRVTLPIVEGVGA
jgi:signal transduction histidine kinase